MKRTTREWVRRAEGDWKDAQILAKGNSKSHDGVCFHCQQLVEKYLKAILVENSVNFPKSHDLDRLLLLVLPIHPSLRSFRRGMLYLSEFAVEVRYPEYNASKRQALAAIRWMEQIREECRTLLGIKPPLATQEGFLIKSSVAGSAHPRRFGPSTILRTCS
ncbi:MAG TPA: HEPN domain-containing protein [Gemmataceae bacterium]|jgi:HEPN domain-containing protein|nr:HEPN domain-containing protein [Gemmataceae bacterium]